MARPSIVPIALTLDDRTGYTLWAPPWEEDGEEWQAFLGTTEDDPDTGSTARVHLFPTPAALAAFCRSSTDHDLADHPVWPVVAGLGAAVLSPDDDHRFDLDGGAEERLPLLAVLLPRRSPEGVAGAVVESECDGDDAGPGHG